MSDYAAGPVRTISNAEEDDNPALRPRLIAEFVGQKEIIDNLQIFINAARYRKEPLDHVLLYGPPGLGKTTIAQIVAAEMGSQIKTVTGPAVQRAGDLAAILSSLDHHDVLFIDEIHRLQPSVEEMLYGAMEDFKLDIIIGEGQAARTIQIDLPKFTLVGATTRSGMLSNPLRDRFGIPLKLEFYSPDELLLIIMRAARLLNIRITENGSIEIAKRSRGTPRIAGRLLRRVRDFATAKGGIIDEIIADESLQRLGIDNRGLDSMDRRYLERIAQYHNGGPVGVETLAAALSESRETLEDVIEPYLLQCGLLLRTSRGRMLPEAAAANNLILENNGINGDMPNAL